MKYIIKIKKLSFSFLGNILLVYSFIYLCLSIYRINILSIVITIFLIILSFLVRRQSKYIIFRNKIFVAEKINYTLKLLRLEAEKNANKVIIKKTKTTITIYSLFGLVILSFVFFDRNSEKEKFLATTLVKFQLQD